MAKPSQLDLVSGLCKNKEFRSQWECLYNSTMMYVRIHCKDLFSDNIWQDVVKYQVDGQIEVIQKYSEELLNEVVKYFDEKIRTCEGGLCMVSEKMQYIVTRDELKKKYGNEPYRFIETLVTCLKEEEVLIDHYTKPNEEELKKENITRTIKLLEESETFERNLEKKVKNFNSLLEEEKQKNKELGKKEKDKQEAQNMPESSRRKNGVNSGNILDKLNNDMLGIQRRLVEIERETDRAKHAIKDALRDFLTRGTELKKTFLEVITKWKKQSKSKYVALVETDYPLKEMEDRCKKYGKLLYNTLEFIQADLLVLSNCKWDMEIDVDLQDIINNLCKLFEEICQSTFLVTEQTRHLIKVELGSKKRTKDAADDEETKPGKTFKCPKFTATVRLIATESLVGRQKVTAHFCHEDSLNDIHQRNAWEELPEKSFPLLNKGNSRTMPFGQQGYATFRNLELTDFKRDQDKHVCEEKYRIVFVTEQIVAGKKIVFRTISLPIIITTGASQGSNAHGSLLWQCFSVEDLMDFPLTSPSVLPWSTVSAMLNSKFKTLDGRDLRQDELMHLASRLSGLPKSNITGKTEIQFRKFCLDKMMDVKESKDAKNKSATFWMWVLSVYNLTKFHLQDYWTEGLIDGFSAKEDCETKLKFLKPFKNYTFLLRFSDKVITDGQGQNMCGAVSASFVYKTEKGEIKVGHAKPFKADSFKKKNLAQLVKSVHLKENNEEVSLQFIYPGEISRDEAFAAFYQASSKMTTPDYLDFEERLYVRLNGLSIDDNTVKEEPPSDIPVTKKSKQETTTPTYAYSDQQINDMVASYELDKYEQPSPSSTLYGGGERNSNESTPMSQEPSPASTYNIMSPESAVMNGMGYSNGYPVLSPQGSLSSGIAAASPQSSIDESQVLSPEQEASIPVTVLDEIGVNGIQPGFEQVLNGNCTYGTQVNGNVCYNVPVQGLVYNRSQSLPDQHPTLINLLKNKASVEGLKQKLLSKHAQGTQPPQYIPVRETNQIDLNSVQKELTAEQVVDFSNLMTFAEHNQDENFGIPEVDIPSDSLETINQSTDLMITEENNANMIHTLQQMVTDPEQLRNFGQLMSVLTEFYPQNPLILDTQDLENPDN
ncbi:signal transducer and activator of transcription 1-like [Mytilus edulis]|uniref:signal transducer and activator of transcription 1-like n=1 Tax=Mytilus edulis TaxID=6550 RepID=UPI0039EDF54E